MREKTLFETRLIELQRIMESLRSEPPQKQVAVRRGLTARLTKNGIGIGRLHYSAMALRDPEVNPAWRDTERKKYTAQAAWDREQEIMDEAGGGELVLADLLITYWNKIVIEDPRWRPETDWSVEGGFDHGKTNPTCLLRCYTSHEGISHYAGEYYQPGREIWQHAPMMKSMYDFERMETIMADSTMFNMDQQQEQRPGHAPERAKSLANLYYDAGIENLYPFTGDKSDVGFAARLQEAWRDLDKGREPTVKIFCPKGLYTDSPVPGLCNWGCPNLLWELMHIRRQKLTAQQLLTRNLSEAIVDKDNHAWDAMKYHYVAGPEVPEKPLQQRMDERMAELYKVDRTTAAIKFKQVLNEELEEDEDEDNVPVGFGTSARLRIRWAERQLYRRRLR